MTLIYPFQTKKKISKIVILLFIFVLFDLKTFLILGLDIRCNFKKPFSIIFRPYLKSKFIRNILDDPHISFAKKNQNKCPSKSHFFIYTLFQRRKNIYFLWNSPFSIIFRPYLKSKVIRNILDDPHISFWKK